MGQGDEYYIGSAYANPGRAPQAQAGFTFDVGDIVVYREEKDYLIDGIHVPFSVGQVQEINDTFFLTCESM